MNQRGFTLVEALMALVIGGVLLAAAMMFLNSTSKTIGIGEKNTKNTSTAQQALSRMVKEIKGMNVDTPPLYSVTPVWTTLPALPYNSLEIFPYPNTAGTVAVPTVPAARLFASQSSPADIFHKWYPNPNGNEANSLVFYKAPAPGPGGTANVERISYRLDDQHRLIREVQRPIIAGSLAFQTSPVPERRILSEEVETIQFTYPQFERAMNSTLDTDLTTLQTNEGYSALQVFINQSFRNIIEIRIVMQGGSSGGKDFQGVELKTEVRLRNE